MDDAQRQETLIDFFEPLLASREAAMATVEQCVRLPDRRPWRIMNTIERLDRLSEEIAALRPGRAPLTVFFLVVCIESIYTLADVGPDNKVEMLIHFFDRHVRPEDRATLIRGVRRSFKDGRWPERGHDLSLETVARLVNELRNLFVHEGVFWQFHFAETEPVLNVVTLKEAGEKEETEHVYEVSLTLAQFRDIVLRGCVSFLQEVLRRVPEKARVQA